MNDKYFDTKASEIWMDLNKHPRADDRLLILADAFHQVARDAVKEATVKKCFDCGAPEEMCNCPDGPAQQDNG